jgi:hypothetical protein
MTIFSFNFFRSILSPKQACILKISIYLLFFKHPNSSTFKKKKFHSSDGSFNFFYTKINSFFQNRSKGK